MRKKIFLALLNLRKNNYLGVEFKKRAIIGKKIQTPTYNILLSQDEVCPTCGLQTSATSC